MARVVVALQDPFPRVSGGGLAQLRAAGIEVDVGVLQSEAEQLSAAYLKRLGSGRPWVIAKWAMTLDGRIATKTGDSQWISGEVSRGEVHRLRGLMDAVVIGAGTVAADDPLLTARPPGPRTATRVVVAGNRLPRLGSRLLRTLDQAPLLIVAPSTVSQAALEPLAAAGAEVMVCDTADPVKMIAELLDELGRRQMTYLLVEGGGGLLGSFLSAGEIDEVHAYIATKAVGGSTAKGPVEGIGFVRLIDSPQFELASVTQLDGDVCITARRRREA